ncbi:MAG TPA: zinc ribbon domain-containing protein [Aggregatilinea sp.]|uniref:zinc ribbon domain-containing protein n=1 Tax=Aggregatilinea sp. TaxID=2806333 RepID=UPI002C871FC0|nr:zinc ribbon domain-containing protein [Aggregatilinea sp.]HML24005.1 zinc ribbon domain-containing protein [Aggregatilinea sp.]
MSQANNEGAASDGRRGAGSYQMLWDCRFCGTAKLLGVTHRHCPNCGAAQDPAWRYFPAEEDMVALADHKYVGADVTCPACGQPNSAASKFCGECGADLATGQAVQTQGARDLGRGAATADTRRDVVKDQFDAEMKRAGVTKDAPGFLSTTKGRVILAAVIGVLILVCAGIIYAVTYSKAVTGEVEQMTWERSVDLQVYRQVNNEDWEDDVPGDAYGIDCERKQHGTKKVEDGSHEECKDVDKGDGSFERQCTTVTDYRDEPVYDQYCEYTVDRWLPGRSVSANGEGEQPAPEWPAFSLAGGTYGKERESERHETYSVIVKDSEGDTHTCEFNDEATWAQYSVGAKVDLKVGIGGTADCDTLALAG